MTGPPPTSFFVHERDHEKDGTYVVHMVVVLDRAIHSRKFGLHPAGLTSHWPRAKPSRLVEG